MTAGNIKAGTTLFGVLGTFTADADAGASDLLSGKKAYVNGTLVTGTMPTQTPNPSSTSFSAGYYPAFNLSTVDTDLISANIRSGVAIFGISGNSKVVETSSGTATAADIVSGKKAWVAGTELTGTLTPASVPKTGQTTSYATGDDGDLERGVAWPSPRFIDNNNGTVTDHLTGLIWLKNANCFGAMAWEWRSLVRTL